MKTQVQLFIMIAIMMFISCTQSTDKSTISPATMYYGGEIITMVGNEPQYVEALVVRDGKIIFTGNEEDAMKAAGRGHVMVDLKGKTMVPGFIDSHSHFANAITIMGQANVSSPPVGGCTNIAGIVAELQKCKTENNIKDGEWVIGWGYDESQLNEKRHPTKADLDKAFPNNPVYIQHVSGHMGVANSLALDDGKIDAKTPDPAGGMILRLPGSKEPSGVLQEMAVHHYVDKITAIFNSKRADLIQKALDLYAANGITTAQEGLTDATTVTFFKQMASDNKLTIDINVLASFLDLEKNLKDTSLHFGEIHNHLKFAGTKVVADGSPQGKTAFFTKPFLTEVPGCSHDCKGFPNITQEQLNTLFETCYKNNHQLYVHCNGDATMDMLLKAHETACKTTGQPLDADRRTTVIHSNFVRMDQLAKYKAYNIIPSFFTNHAFYWGDVHVENLGQERAFFLSPIHSADSLGITYTNHTDYIITPINQIFTMWSAVNRVSRTGKVIGPNERATPYQALKALTINAAIQHGDEKTKGSLAPGKLADLVVLDQNPLKVDAQKIKDIQVVETIKDGKSVFKKG